MTTPVLGAYDPNTPEYVFVKIGTATTITGTGTANMLAQVQSITIHNVGDKEERTWRRLGAAPSRGYGKALYSCEVTIVLNEQPDRADYMTATNDTTPASIDSDTAVHIQKQIYSEAGTLMSTEHVIDCYLAEDTSENSAGNQEGTTTLRFTSANRSVVQTSWS